MVSTVLSVDWSKTAALYRAAPPTSLPNPPSLLFDRRLQLRRGLYRLSDRVLARAGAGRYSLLTDILRIQSSLQSVPIQRGVSGRVRVLLRIDDFPRWDLSVEECHSAIRLIAGYKIPFVLGVTPLLAVDPFDCGNIETRTLTTMDENLLRLLQDQGCRIALHGLTHRRQPGLKAEYAGLSEQEITQSLDRGIELLTKAGLRIDSIIAPFNAFDKRAFRVFARYFKAVFGGPESIDFFDGFFTPSYIDDTFYIASYAGTYGRARDILSMVRRSLRILGSATNSYLPITIHWAWEASNSYRDLCELLTYLRDELCAEFVVI